jgi:hypothetical protein
VNTKSSSSSSSAPGPDKRITDATIVAAFTARRGLSSRRKFWQDVMAATGMKISYSHFVNILKGRRSPNEVVLRYMGLEKVEGYRGVKAQ